MLKPALSTYLDTESSGSSSLYSSTLSLHRPNSSALRPLTPLTTENLHYHSRYTAEESSPEELVRRFQASLDREKMISPTSSTFRRSKRSRSSMSQDTFIETPQYSMFPYHNDSFMLPTTPRSSSNSTRSPWASSTVVGEMSFETTRARAAALGADRPATKSDPSLLLLTSKSHHTAAFSANTKRASLPHDSELKLLYTEARRPSKLSVTISKLLQWLTPAGVKTRKDLRRRTSRSWHIRMED
ncbi:hypothetical protein K450DRAFT_247824 [Umbelopsis ramanniana AG]|uniref:Uncharacterized protein n=1 Tax=Umbelopsis ramanniana AG TaxID=1314678 RepID=A0AAD5HBK0_UMBRA|nr:uncharacterized protein K450DRAFT_247824 [Umbelopsis ramanniana AG]KAI8578220.1 hypothetical protein K450DRAFT_247824 [Umbelopsis ramanniana AG]